MNHQLMRSCSFLSCLHLAFLFFYPLAHNTRSMRIVTLMTLVIFVFFCYCELATVSTDFLRHLLRILLKVLSRGSTFPWDTWQLSTNRFSRSHATGCFPPWRCLHKSSMVAPSETELNWSVIFSLFLFFCFHFLRIPRISKEMCSRKQAITALA